MLRALVLVSLLAPSVAAADDRPALSGAEVIFDAPSGRVRLHYTTAGVDAVNPEDVDPQNGVPDLVDDFVTGIDDAWNVFVGEDGWTAPLPDEGRGGDDRLDAYVRAIDANGYTHYEPVAGGHSAYIELNPAVRGLGRVGARSVSAHEFHHALQAALTVGAGAWIYEATATWAQYLLYEGDPILDVGRDALWLFRLEGAARGLDDVGDRFEYAGMVWVKFLLDHGRQPRRAVLDLWRAMAQAGGWAAGHEAVARQFGFASLDEAVATFHEWNLFACQRDDGRHYDPQNLPCSIKAGVKTVAPPTLPSSGATAPVGPRGAIYLEPARDCATDTLHVRVVATGPFAVRAVKVHGAGGSESAPSTSGGGTLDVSVGGWNDAARTVLVLVNLDGAAQSFAWQATADGSYRPAPTVAAATHVALEPAAPLDLRVGATAQLTARGTFGACSDGSDLTAAAEWRSSDESVATVSAGLVRAVGPGHAEITVATGADASADRVAVDVQASAVGCAIADHGAPGLPLLALAIIALALRRTAACPRAATRGSSSGMP